MTDSVTPLPPNRETRIRDSFARQTMMTTLGVTILDLGVGSCVLSAPVAPHLLQQHGAAHAALAAVLQHGGQGGRRGGDDRDVHRLRQGAHVRIGWLVADGRVPRVDVKDGTAKAAFAQIPAQHVADRTGGGARADHGDGCGAQHGLDAFRGHC